MWGYKKLLWPRTKVWSLFINYRRYYAEHALLVTWNCKWCFTSVNGAISRNPENVVHFWLLLFGLFCFTIGMILSSVLKQSWVVKIFEDIITIFFNFSYHVIEIITRNKNDPGLRHSNSLNLPCMCVQYLGEKLVWAAIHFSKHK